MLERMEHETPDPAPQTEQEDPASSSPASAPAAEAPRRHYALLGLLAAGAALAASEVIAGLFLSAPSLILTIGQRFIDITPPALKDWAISVFGTADKAVFIAGMAVVVLILGALLGMLSKRRPWPAAAGFAVFGAAGYVIGLTDPLAEAGPTLLAAVTAAAVGAAAMWALRSLLPGAAAASAGQAESALEVQPPPPSDFRSRRAFLASSGAAAALAVGAAAFGRFLTNRARTVVTGREQVTLPTASASPASTAAASTADDAAAPTTAAETAAEGAVSSAAAPETTAAAAPPVSTVPDPAPSQIADIPGVSPLVTPNESFYVIDTALSIPQVDLDTWTLTFRGRADNPFSLTYDELLAMPMVERYITLCCVSNEVGGSLVGNAKWLGVPLRNLVEQAGVWPEGDQVVGRSVEGFTVGFPTSAVFDGREALVAVGMNGEPLPLRHGFPARLVVSGLYGYVSATKWLSEVEFAGWDDFDAYWIPRGWSKVGPIKTQSRIDTPRSGNIPVGNNFIAGVAWAQNRGVEGVEVQVDDGPWMEAALPEELTIDTWRQWHLEYDFPPGPHTVSVRASDSSGETQTAERTGARPDGATGYHTIRVNAAA